MQSAKEKISNMASAAKEHLTICKAKVGEKVEKSTARTHEQKVIAKERRKAKEAQAKMELHQAKAKHAADRLKYQPPHHHHHHHHHRHQHQYPPVVGAQYGPTEAMVGTHPNHPVGNTAL